MMFPWYGFLIALAIVLGVALGYFIAKMRGKNPDIAIDFIIWATPLAILGCRTYYVILDSFARPGYWDIAKFFGFFDGKFEGLEGLAIHGGIIGAILGAIFCGLMFKKQGKKDGFFDLADLGAPFMLLGQAIGRWGNYANQEVYGRAITDGLNFFPFAVDINGTMHVALFFYESIFNLIGAGVLAWMYLGKRRSAKGTVFFGYLLWYGLVRIIMEGMRVEEYTLGTFQYVMCAIMIAVGLGWFVYQFIQAKRNNRKLPLFVTRADWRLTGREAEEFGALPSEFKANLFRKIDPNEGKKGAKNSKGIRVIPEAELSDDPDNPDKISVQSLKPKKPEEEFKDDFDD
jgi:prolipoprotein diacylglyceryl transferase